MFLKRIRMIGFKSFADETVIEPREGITAVVGPNGCGKSNIVDAVRWVLGEKSARGLRGKSMEDVIFLGSESRRPAGMAEVEMVFDNLDRSLPVEQDEFSIGRRIYVNSASEYLMNGKRTTRKEIEKIFLDTGIGKSAYSIMEQGRMSEILKASPEDRRALFDEAAGISRFKAERAETLTRLSDTEQNLLRLTDILKSKKDELDHLEKQARKTREYLRLKEHLDKHDLNLRYLQLSELEEKEKKVRDKLESLAKKRDEIQERIYRKDEEAVEKEKQNEELIEQRHKLDREFHQALSRIESINHRLGNIRQHKEERTEKRKSLDERIKAEQNTYKQIQKRIQDSKQLELNLNTEMESLQESSTRLAEALEKLNQQIEESQEKESQNNQQLEAIDQEQASLVEEMKAVTGDLIQELESRRRELEGVESRRVDLRNSIIAGLEKSLEKVSEVMQELENGSAKKARNILASLRLEELSRNFLAYEAVEQDFRSVLFGETGLFARKEELDNRMDQLKQTKETIQKESNRLFEKRKLDLRELEKQKHRKIELDLQIQEFRLRRESSAETRENVQSQLEQTEKRLQYHNEEYESLEKEINAFANEEKELGQELNEYQKNSARQTGQIDLMKKKIEKIRDEISTIRERSRKDRESIEKIMPEMITQERAAESVAVARNSLEEDLYNDFQMSPSELIEKASQHHIRKNEEESAYRRIKSEIQALGQFNALAIEELSRAKEAYDELLKQKKDIEDARENITEILEKIEDKSRTLFLETFTRIQNNFTEVFQTLFGGGTATLTLSDEADPMKSGIEIMVQPPGKKNSSITLLSGGEQNMTAIALMFATYLVRPSPFCLLDEIDAPLDDSNVMRFLKMLSGFSQRSQFLVITHNKLTMSRAAAVFGVTQEEPGTTKIVSVRFNEGRTAG